MMIARPVGMIAMLRSPAAEKSSRNRYGPCCRWFPATETDTIAVVGTVQPRFQTDYGFRILGRLIARPVNVGDTVAAGQALAAVDAFAAEFAVRSSLAELSTAQGQLVNAAATAERQRTLIETGATTKATLDSAEQSKLRPRPPWFAPSPI